MNESIEQANELHYEALAKVAAFVKSDGKIITKFKVKHKLPKGTINKKSREKPDNTLMTSAKKFERVMNAYMSLTSLEVINLTGLDSAVMFRAARKCEDAGLITRVTGKGMGGLTTFNLAK